MRKILYTSSYGAGWSSWCSNPKIAKFVATYQPVIEAVEKRHEELNKLSFGERYHATVLEQNHPSIQQLLKEVKEKFDYNFYAGGSQNLAIAEIPDVALAKIQEYDGRESVNVVYMDEDLI